MLSLRPCLLILTALAMAQQPGSAWANWQRVTTRTVQETSLNNSQSAGFLRDSIQAVSGLAINANANLIQQGLWNSSVQFSPATAGGTFSLLQNSQSADPLPPNSFAALNSPSTERSTSHAPNQLDGWMTTNGVLNGAPGTHASEINLTTSQTLSVF